MDSNEMKKVIFLKHAEDNEVYTILLTEEEAKCLGAGKFIHSLVFFSELLLQNI